MFGEFWPRDRDEAIVTATVFGFQVLDETRRTAANSSTSGPFKLV